MLYLELTCDRLDDVKAELAYEMLNPVDTELFVALTEAYELVGQALEKLTTIRQAMRPAAQPETEDE